MKQRGVTVEAAGDPGLTKANHQFLKPVEIPWEGATTLAALFEQSCQKHSAQSALGTREYIKKEVEITPDGKCFDKLTLGAYKWISYKEVLDQASCFASGLVALGHRRNERCAIFAETCAEWFIALQGCFRQSVTVVTMYASLGEDAVAYSFNETEVSTVICDRKQFKKLADARMKLKTIKRVVIMDDPADTSEVVCPCLVNWALNAISDIKKLGKEKPVPAKMPAASEIALIMYTSGSTGLPKGVVMTHGNIVAAVAGELRVTPNLGPNDRYLAYLPLAHVFELTGECALFSAGSGLGYGSPLTLTDTSSKIKKGTKGDAAELKPTLLVETKGGLTKTLFDLAYGRSLTALEGNGSVFWGIEKQLWDNLIFKKVRASLGGSIKCILSGGAPLSRDTQWFINICFGVLIGQGYGLTETCGGGTISEWDDICVGRVGSPAPQCYVKEGVSSGILWSVLKSCQLLKHKLISSLVSMLLI